MVRDAHRILRSTCRGRLHHTGVPATLAPHAGGATGTLVRRGTCPVRRVKINFLRPAVGDGSVPRDGATAGKTLSVAGVGSVRGAGRGGEAGWQRRRSPWPRSGGDEPPDRDGRERPGRKPSPGSPHCSRSCRCDSYLIDFCTLISPPRSACAHRVRRFLVIDGPSISPSPGDAGAAEAPPRRRPASKLLRLVLHPSSASRAASWTSHLDSPPAFLSDDRRTPRVQPLVAHQLRETSSARRSRFFGDRVAVAQRPPPIRACGAVALAFRFAKTVPRPPAGRSPTG
jgi:hypothetical protein